LIVIDSLPADIIFHNVTKTLAMCTQHVIKNVSILKRIVDLTAANVRLHFFNFWILIVQVANMVKIVQKMEVKLKKLHDRKLYEK